MSSAVLKIVITQFSQVIISVLVNLLTWKQNLGCLNDTETDKVPMSETKLNKTNL